MSLAQVCEPVKLGVQQPRQTAVELVGTGKDAGGSIERSLKTVSRINGVNV